MSDDNLNNGSKRYLKIAAMSALEPFALILSILITLTVMLHAWDSSVFSISKLFLFANNSNSVSDLIAVIIPLAAITALNVLFHILRHASHIKEMFLTYTVFGFFSSILTYLLVLNLLYWTRYFDQNTPLGLETLNEVENVVIASMLLIVGLSIALSVRSEMNAQIDGSLRVSPDD